MYVYIYVCNFQKKLNSKSIESVVGSVSDPDLGSIIRVSSETSLSQQGSDFYDRLLLYSTLKRFDCARDWDSSHSDIVISLHPWLSHCRHVSESGRQPTLWTNSLMKRRSAFSTVFLFPFFIPLYVFFCLKFDSQYFYGNTQFMQTNYSVAQNMFRNPH